MTTYSDFQDDVKDHVNRQDLSTAQLDNFIDLAEAGINRKLRVAEMYTSTTLTFSSSDTTALPTDYLDARSVTITKNSRQYHNLELMSPENLNAIYALSSSTEPKAYTIEGSNMRIAPGPDSEYEITFNYYARPAPFTASVVPDTFTAYKDLYLWATCRQAAIFLRNDENTVKYNALFKSVLDEIDTEAQNARFGGNSLQMHNTSR